MRPLHSLLVTLALVCTPGLPATARAALGGPRLELGLMFGF